MEKENNVIKCKLCLAKYSTEDEILQHIITHNHNGNLEYFDKVFDETIGRDIHRTVNYSTTISEIRRKINNGYEVNNSLKYQRLDKIIMSPEKKKTVLSCRMRGNNENLQTFLVVAD